MDATKDHLKTAIQAAKVAAEPLKTAATGYRTIHMEEAHDVKLQADLESERKIREYLGSVSPFAIIGEEEGGDPSLWDGDEYYWVIDPLDGTYNYLREYPQCCVSVGLMRGQSAVCGAIYDFNNDTLYTGGKGLSFKSMARTIKPSGPKVRAKRA
jgi:myo-inositol-1(or 4)-monophosphatase